jgi:hypothetical protein
MASCFLSLDLKKELEIRFYFVLLSSFFDGSFARPKTENKQKFSQPFLFFSERLFATRFAV